MKSAKVDYERKNCALHGRAQRQRPVKSFLLPVDIVLLLIAAIFKDGIGRYVYPLVFVLLAYAYFRMLSATFTSAARKNGKHIRARYKVSAALRGAARTLGAAQGL